MAKRTKHRSPTGRRQGTRGIGFQAPRDEPFGDSPRPSRRPTERLAETAVVQVTGTDPDGDAIARPVTWDKTSGPPPMILMHAEASGRPALAPGEKVLARLKPVGPGRYEGRTLRRLTEAPGRILGVFKAERRENRIVPTDRRSKAEWIVPAGYEAGAEPNEIVLAEPLAQQDRLGLKPARVLERLGRLGDARSVSLIAIHTHDIPQQFSAAALDEAAGAHAIRLGSRTDLRTLGLLTIDGADARDLDDAVYAEPYADSPGGFRLVIAIADVAHYVRPGSALDDAGRTRGNSVYFPDRVVPMLPEALSNGWCSLHPDEDRLCLFADIRIDRHGRKVSHQFGRGLMRSAARLTYEAAQRAQDAGDDLGLSLPHLYGRFRPCCRHAGSVAHSISTCPNEKSRWTTRGTWSASRPARAWTAIG